MKFIKAKYSKISYIAAAAFLLVFAFISIFGMSMSMQMRDDGTMGRCPLMANSSVLCGMTVPEHVGLWQRMFFSTPAGNFFTALAALFILFLLALFSVSLAKKSRFFAARRFYLREHPDSRLFGFLSAFIGRGLLHPKLYA